MKLLITSWPIARWLGVTKSPPSGVERGEGRGLTSSAPRGADFLNRSLTFQADTKDVLSGVDISIVRRPALAAFPASYSKRTHAFRAAVRNNPAARARLGTVSLISLDIHRLPSGSFVPQHVSERRPARIQNGFRHSGLRKLRSAHIANNDQRIFTCQLCTGDVEMVFPRIAYFGHYRTRSRFATRALGLPERYFIAPVEPFGLDYGAIAASRQRLEPKVDTYLTIAPGQIVFDLASKTHIPTPACVLRETAVPHDALDFARPPKAKSTLQVDHGVVIDFYCARLKRDPSQRPLAPETGSEARTPSVLISRLNELSANGADRIRVKPEIGRGPGAQIDQVESGRPSHTAVATPTPLSLFLCRGAEVPNLVAGGRKTIEVLTAGGVFDAVFERDDHRRNLSLSDPDFKRLGAA